MRKKDIQEKYNYDFDLMFETNNFILCFKCVQSKSLNYSINVKYCNNFIDSVKLLSKENNLKKYFGIFLSKSKISNNSINTFLDNTTDNIIFHYIHNETNNEILIQKLNIFLYNNNIFLYENDGSCIMLENNDINDIIIDIDNHNNNNDDVMNDNDNDNDDNDNVINDNDIDSLEDF